MPPQPGENAGGEDEKNGFFDRFFGPNESLEEQIHRQFPSEPPKTLHEEMEQMFKAFPGFGSSSLSRGGDSSNAMYSSSPLSSSSYQIHQDQNQVVIDVDVPGVAVDNMQVQVIDTPACVVQWSAQRGNHQKHTSTGNYKQQQQQHYHRYSSTSSHRLRLGNSVDCENLSANLSRGVLRLKAPIKREEEQQGPEIRNIPITEETEH